jgi:hypothetical protein
MALLEGKSPAERNKLIAAIALGAVALLSLSYLFFGGSSSNSNKTTRNSNAAATASPSSSPTTSSTRAASIPNVNDVREADITRFMRPIIFTPTTPPPVPDGTRNIFAFYVPKPTPTPTPTPVAPTPTPTPTPTPPLLVTSVSPSNVYARQDDFTLEISGDKFTPQTHIVFGGSELPTRFVSAQQLSATVPAVMIASEGQRPIIVRSPDGQLYSNPATLNVSPAPIPNYAFVGLIARKRGGNDTAVLRDKSSKDLLNVQRGDVIGGRFRITSISEREVALIDNTLHIKHSLPFNNSDSPNGDLNSRNPQLPRPNQPQTPPKSDEDEDEIP